MKSHKTPLKKERESDFRQLVRKTLASRAPVEALLEDYVFKKRLRLITMAHARTAEDAEELANDVSTKVWQNLHRFKPDERYPYDGFFSWLRIITRNTFIDSLRRRKVEFADQPVEELNIADPQIEIESSVLYKEVMSEFEKSIYDLPPTERLAITFYLQGFTINEISEKMREAGFSTSRVRVRTGIKRGLQAFFPQARHLLDYRSENARVTRIRTTRAKKQFHTILEQAINSGSAGIASEDLYRPTPTHARHRRSEEKQTGTRLGWHSANELLKSMQSRESRKGIQAAFEASSEALGDAAAEYATNKRKVSVSSLTTFLMATSTANVVGRVMNLSQDAS